MSHLSAPEDFADWNEEMIRRHDPDTFYNHPIPVVRWVEAQRVKAIVHGLELKAESSLLDVGCGAGSLLNVLTCREMTGIELSPTMAARARERVGSDARILEGNAEDLPFPDHAFDRVVASSLLSHVLHPERVVKELKRVTRPGGLVVVSISDEGQIERGMKWAKNLGFQKLFGGDKVSEAQSAYHVDYHLHRFSLLRLRTLVGDDLEEISVTRIPFFFAVHDVVVYGA
jgi:SAM-dependent methyltransferase